MRGLGGPRRGGSRLTVALTLVALMLAPGLIAASPAVWSGAWTVERPFGGGSPQDLVALTGPTGPAVAVASGDRVEVVDATGRVVWAHVGLARWVHRLAAADVTGDGVDDVIVSSATVPRPDAPLVLIDGARGRVVWEVSTAGAQVNEIIVLGEGASATVVVAAMPALHAGAVQALDAATGAERWRALVDEPVTSLAAVDGRVAAGTTDGRVLFLDAGTGATRGVVPLAGEGVIRDLVALPVTGHVRLAVVSERAVTGLMLTPDPTGLLPVVAAPAWSHRAADARFWSAAAGDLDADGRVEVAAVAWKGTHVHVVDALTGERHWTAGDGGVRTSLPFASPRALALGDADADGRLEVYAAGASGELRAFDAAGHVRWASPLAGPTDAVAVLPGSSFRVAHAHPGGIVVAVDGAGGEAWSRDYGSHRAAVLRDWNGDGIGDVAVATAAEAHVMDGRDGSVLFHADTWSLLANGFPGGIEAADLDSDGVTDLVVAVRNSNVQGRVVAIDGTGGRTLWSFATDHVDGRFAPGLRLADVTGDGVPDALFAGNRGYPTYVHALDGATGAEVWAHHVQDDVDSFTVAEARGAPPVLAFVRGHWSCGCHDASALVALDATTGAVLWERVVPDDFPVVHTARGADGLPRLVVLDGSPDRADALLLDPWTGDVRARIPVDDAGGVVAPFFVPVDVDGDGADEVVTAYRAGGRGGSATSWLAAHAPDGSRAWVTPRADGVVRPEAGPERAGGGQDVLAIWNGAPRVSVHSGADGAFVRDATAPGRGVTFAGATGALTVLVTDVAVAAVPRGGGVPLE